MNITEYLKVRPVGLKYAPSFYYLGLKVAISYFIFHRIEFGNKEYDENLIKVKYNDILFNVRRSSFIHDIQHYLLRQEPNIRNWFDFQRGEVFVDVGAYIGAYTLRAAKNGCVVYSFEPNPNSFKILSMNVKDNGFNNVELFNVAVGDHEGEVYITLDLDTTKVSDRGYKVKMITLDSLKLRRVDWLKIDVEGFEKEVLMGAQSTLDVTSKIIIEVWKKNRDFVEKIMEIHGFKKVKEEETYPEIYNIMYMKSR